MRGELLYDLYSHDDSIPASLQKLLIEQQLELPGACNDILAQIFSCSTEPKVGSEILPYTDRLTYAAQLGLKTMPGQFHVNTFPFGARTPDVFSEFIGICSGETTVLHALNAVMSYCESVQGSLPPDDEKTVILLSDKWDGPRFQHDFEFPFLNFALTQNILFVFLLVTDYGVTRIPFLARNHMELQRIRTKQYTIETEHPSIAALAALKRQSPCYLERHSGTWERLTDTIRFEFDFRRNRCIITGIEAEPQIKRIPPSAARRFALTTYHFMQNIPDKYCNHPVKDAGFYRAEVFGSYFEWGMTHSNMMDDPWRKISNAFHVLISSLKES